MSHKKMGPIGSAVLTFIGYKRTDKPNLFYGYIYIVILSEIQIHRRKILLCSTVDSKQRRVLVESGSKYQTFYKFFAFESVELIIAENKRYNVYLKRFIV